MWSASAWVAGRVRVLWSRYARRERIKQQYAAIAADKLYSDVPPTIADEDYGPVTSVSTAYMKAVGRSPLRRPPATDYTHVWQLPLPQPLDDTVAGCVTASSAGGAAYSVGSVDSRYYVLDHNQSSSVIPTNDDIQFTAAQWHGVVTSDKRNPVSWDSRRRSSEYPDVSPTPRHLFDQGPLEYLARNTLFLGWNRADMGTGAGNREHGWRHALVFFDMTDMRYRKLTRALRLSLCLPSTVKLLPAPPDA